MIKSIEKLVDKTRCEKRYPGLASVLVVALLTLPSDGQAGADDSPTVDWGRDLYMSYCVSCHGWTGK